MTRAYCFRWIPILSAIAACLALTLAGSAGFAGCPTCDGGCATCGGGCASCGECAPCGGCAPCGDCCGCGGCCGYHLLAPLRWLGHVLGCTCDGCGCERYYGEFSTPCCDTCDQCGHWVGGGCGVGGMPGCGCGMPTGGCGCSGNVGYQMSNSPAAGYAQMHGVPPQYYANQQYRQGNYVVMHRAANTNAYAERPVTSGGQPTYASYQGPYAGQGNTTYRGPYAGQSYGKPRMISTTDDSQPGEGYDPDAQAARPHRAGDSR